RQNLNRVTPISDEEIDAAIARQRATADQPRARVSEIFLAVSNPQQDAEVHRFADQLFEQLRGGARFPALAQQLSQSATAAVGGGRASQSAGGARKVRSGDLPPVWREIGFGVQVALASPPVALRGGVGVLMG